MKAGLMVVCLLMVFASVAAMAATPAGTSIKATATAQYKSSSGTQMPTATSNTVTITVGQSASVGVSPTSSTKTADGSLNAYYGLTITNNGGSTDTFDLTASAKSGSKVTIYKDDNGDGSHQSTETTVVSATGALSSGGTSKVVVAVQLSSSGTSDTVTFIAKSRADATKTGQSVLTIQKSASGGAYIQNWLLNGYYPNTNLQTQMSTDYLSGEAGVGPTEGSSSGGKTWAKFISTAPYVNLWTYYGKPLNCVGYAFTYINSPSAQTVTIKTGSDDGIKVWLNGSAVLTQDVYRGYVADADSAQMSLTAGWNKMLVKITQKNFDWGFSLKVCDSAGNTVPGLTYALTPSSGNDTTAPTISNVKVTPGATSATVQWDTNEPSSTLLDYGKTSSLGTDYTDTGMTTHHSATVASLSTSTTYYVKVGSADGNGNTAWNGPTTFQTTAATAYAQVWLVNGYYPNTNLQTQMSTDYLGNEAGVSPSAGSTSGGKTWVTFASSTPYVNLWTYYGKPLYCAGYAFTHVYSPTTQTVTMKTGSDDGIKVWLNGSAVLTQDVYRGYVADSDIAQMSLPAGWNDLLVKVTQKDWDWGFSLKLCDSSGNPAPGVTFSVTQQ